MCDPHLIRTSSLRWQAFIKLPESSYSCHPYGMAEDISYLCFFPRGNAEMLVLIYRFWKGQTNLIALFRFKILLWGLTSLSGQKVQNVNQGEKLHIWEQLPNAKYFQNLAVWKICNSLWIFPLEHLHVKESEEFALETKYLEQNGIFASLSSTCSIAWSLKWQWCCTIGKKNINTVEKESGF